MRCYFEVSTSLLDHFKTCQSKGKKTPHAKATNSPRSVELKGKAIRGGNINQGKCSTTVDSDVDVSDTEDTTAW